MSDPTDFEAPDSPPPPAYEFCQEEFDQKVSHALEASQSEQRRYDEEEWELWDEEKFTAAAARLNLDGQSENAAGSSSAPQPMASPPVHAASASPPPSEVSGNGKAKSDAAPDEWRAGAQVQPLRIVKKNTSLPKEKERPSWYAEAQLGGPQPRPTVVLPDRSVEHRPHRASPPPPMSAYPDERSDTPPPMFTPVGPNLDGPAYEGVVMSYTPGDSRPNSPLHSPPPIEAPMPFSAAQNPPLQSRASGRRSLPQPPQTNARSYSPSISPNPRPQSHSLPMPARQIPPRTSPRPATTYNLGPTGFTPRVAFDPRVAYANEKSSLFSNGPTEEPPPAKIDAAALYSSSVASLYSSSIPAAPQRKPASAPSSFYSQQASQSTYHIPQVPSATPQGIGGYYANRDHMRSPAPSVTSMRSSHSQNASGYQQPAYRPATTYQSNGYQPTSYQPTSY